MKASYRRCLGALCGLGMAGFASAGSLYGIHTTFSGYQLAKVDSATRGVEILASIPLFGLASVNEMTYHRGRQKFVVSATIDNSNAYLVEIDPIDYGISAVGHDIPTNFVEGIEYLPSIQSLVVSYGGPVLTTKVARLDDSYHMTGSGELVIQDLDMDTIYTDQSGSLFKMDVTHWVASTPFARLDNPFTSITFNPIGSDYNTDQYDHDVAYNPSDGRLYLTRASSLAYFNADRSLITNVGSFGSYNITALAYGPEVKSLSGALLLADTVPTFAEPRSIVYSLTQGTNVIASGSVTASNPITIFNIPILDNVSGPATLVWNGSSFLKKTLPVTLTGDNVLVGSVSMANGDCDFSGEVDAVDIDDVIANFGNTFPSQTGNTHSDVDCSGEVDAVDIDLVIAAFGSVDN